MNESAQRIGGDKTQKPHDNQNDRNRRQQIHDLPPSTSTPSQQVPHQAEQEQDQKNEKQNFRNSCGRHGNSRKAQNRGDQSNDEKSQGPAQHVYLPAWLACLYPASFELRPFYFALPFWQIPGFP